MKKTRRHHSSEFKSKVAIEAIKEQKTLSQLTEEYELHANQISEWKKVLVEQSPNLFGRKSDTDSVDIEVITNPLYQQIGQLKVEVEFLKKKLQQVHNRSKS
jgi:transposase-like protein